MARPKDPRTPAEWQDAVNLADAFLRVESAKMYGLISGGPVVNQGRCDVMLRQGARIGVHPVEADVEKIILALAAPEPATPEGR